MCIVKKLCINRMRIVLLIYGFVPVNSKQQGLGIILKTFTHVSITRQGMYWFDPEVQIFFLNFNRILYLKVTEVAIPLQTLLPDLATMGPTAYI